MGESRAVATISSLLKESGLSPEITQVTRSDGTVDPGWYFVSWSEGPTAQEVVATLAASGFRAVGQPNLVKNIVLEYKGERFTLQQSISLARALLTAVRALSLASEDVAPLPSDFFEIPSSPKHPSHMDVASFPCTQREEVASRLLLDFMGEGAPAGQGASGWLRLIFSQLVRSPAEVERIRSTSAMLTA